MGRRKSKPGGIFYRLIKSRGNVYLQLWRTGENGNPVYLCSLGTAEACFSVWKNLEKNQTEQKINKNTE